MPDDSTPLSEVYARKIHLVMDDEDDLHEFSRIVKSFKSKQMLESAAIVKLTGMMRRKFDDLTLGLNSYLSEGFKIEKSENGQLFYRSPTQEDLVPILIDCRMEQVVAELGEAKALLRHMQEEKMVADDTICQQRITIEKMKEERANNKNNLKSLKQQYKLALTQQRKKNKDKIKSFQKDIKLKEEQMQKVKSDLNRFHEESNIREIQLKQRIRELQQDNEACKDSKGSIQHLQAQNKMLLEQLDKRWESESDPMNSSFQHLLTEYEILSAAQADLQTKNEKMKAALDNRIEVKDILVSKIRQRVQSAIADTDCPICLEPVKDTHISPECLHRFCGDCLKESIQKCNNECPMCRVHLSSKRCLRRDEDYDTLVDAFRNIENLVLEAESKGDDKVYCSNHTTISTTNSKGGVDGDNESSMESDRFIEEQRKVQICQVSDDINISDKAPEDDAVCRNCSRVFFNSELLACHLSIHSVCRNVHNELKIIDFEQSRQESSSRKRPRITSIDI